MLAEASNFANLLEVEDLPCLVAVNTKTCRVIATVFLARKSSTEDLENLLATLSGVIASDLAVAVPQRPEPPSLGP